MLVAPPMGTISDGGATRIEEYEFRVEAMPTPHRAIDAPAVAENLRQVVNMDVPKIAGTILARMERDLGKDVIAFHRLQHEADRGAVTTHEDEVDPLGQWGRSERRRTASARAKRLHVEPSRISVGGG